MPKINFNYPLDPNSLVGYISRNEEMINVIAALKEQRDIAMWHALNAAEIAITDESAQTDEDMDFCFRIIESYGEPSDR